MKETGYLTVKQFSEKWGISQRRIIKLCKEGRISGAKKNGMIWVIPEDTIKPSDKRAKISKYINTQKKIIVFNINNEIGYELVPLLNKQGYIVNGICGEKTKIQNTELNNIKIIETSYKDINKLKETINKTDKYYDGLVLIEDDRTDVITTENKEWIIMELSKKMNCESSIVLVNNSKNKLVNLEKKLAKKLKEDIGLRINEISIDVPRKNRVIINHNEIAQDIVCLLTNYKNTTGISITTDGGYLEFDKNGRTKPLETGIFYKTINNYFRKAKKGSTIWCASTMIEDEWTEEPAEMNFRVSNLDAANRGVKLERIFIFSKEKIKEFKNNKTLKIYMQNSNINTMFADYDEIIKKEPNLLKIVADGWDGIDLETLIVDLPSGDKTRGYISISKKEIEELYECFERLKSYSKDLREILK